MEPKLQIRSTTDVGWVLSPNGATVEEAISFSSITNPSNRQTLIRNGFKVLTRHNSNDTPKDYHGDPPSLETCAKVISLVNGRKEKAVTDLKEHLRLAKEEPMADLPPGDRSHWRVRIKDLVRAIARIEDEDVTPEELHRAFRREEVEMRAKEVDPAMRSQIESMQWGQTEAAALAEEDAAATGDWSNDDYEPANDSFEGEEQADADATL